MLSMKCSSLLRYSAPYAMNKHFCYFLCQIGVTQFFFNNLGSITYYYWLHTAQHYVAKFEILFWSKMDLLLKLLTRPNCYHKCLAIFNDFSKFLKQHKTLQNVQKNQYVGYRYIFLFVQLYLFLKRSEPNRISNFAA